MDYEVIVVGAGVMGSATAYYLSQQLGRKVLLLEQFDFLHRKGSSHGDSRIIRYTYPQDHYTELMFDAYKLWAEAEALSKTKVFTQTGGLDFGSKDNPALLKLIDAAKKFKVEHEVFEDAQELAKKFPMLKLEPGNIAVYNPTSGILNATKAVGMFQQLARENGCELRDNTPVKNVKEDGEGLILVEAGDGLTFKTRKCILTSGPWAKKMLKSVANLDLPLNPHEVTVAYWKVSQPDLYSSRNFPVFINYNKPMLYGLPCHEFSNLLKCCPWGGQDCDPHNRPYNPNIQGITNEVGPWLQQVFTGVSPTHQMTESCICTDTPDEDYIIDEVPGFRNLLIGCGFSGHGFKLSPVVGNLLAKWAITERSPYSTKLQNTFSLKRFL